MGTFSDQLATFDPGFIVNSMNSAIKELAQTAFTLNLSDYEKHLQNAGIQFTNAHPGSEATDVLVQKQWGYDIGNNVQPIAEGVGNVAGGIGGPLVGLIAGGVTGAGLSNQFGENNSPTESRQAVMSGAGTGLLSGLLSGDSWGAEAPASSAGGGGASMGSDSASLANAEQVSNQGVVANAQMELGPALQALNKAGNVGSQIVAGADSANPGVAGAPGGPARRPPQQAKVAPTPTIIPAGSALGNTPPLSGDTKLEEFNQLIFALLSGEQNG